MNIFGINELIYKVLAANEGDVDEETGILLDGNLLDNLEAAREDKIEGALLFKRQLESDAAAIKEQAKKMLERAKAIENRADGLENYVIAQLDEFGDKKFESHKIRATLCAGRESLKYEVDKIPQEFVYTESVQKIDTKNLKEKLKAGESITGAWIEKTPYLLIK